MTKHCENNQRYWFLPRYHISLFIESKWPLRAGYARWPFSVVNRSLHLWERMQSHPLQEFPGLATWLLRQYSPRLFTDDRPFCLLRILYIPGCRIVCFSWWTPDVIFAVLSCRSHLVGRGNLQGLLAKEKATSSSWTPARPCHRTPSTPTQGQRREHLLSMAQAIWCCNIHESCITFWQSTKQVISYT